MLLWICSRPLPASHFGEEFVSQPDIFLAGLWAGVEAHSTAQVSRAVSELLYFSVSERENFLFPGTIGWAQAARELAHCRGLVPV